MIAASIRFRLLVVGLAAGLIVLGAVELSRAHTDVLPEFATAPVLQVQTEALGLSSQEVEQYVTVPLENNLLDGIMGVWDVRSDSVPGLSSIDLYFEPGTSVLHDRQLVQERLTQAFALPNVSKPPLLIQPISSTGRVMMIGLTSRTLDPVELSYLARWVVKPRLSGVPGVANVAIFGQQDRQIQVQVDPARLAARHVTLAQIIDSAGNAQLVSPLSYLEGSSPGTGGFIDGPNQRLDIRPVLPLGAPRDLAGVPVTDAPAGLTLGGVATVVQGHQPLIGNGLVRGGPGLVLVVQKLPSASVLGVTHGLERALQDLRPALSGVSIDSSLFRPATYVTDAHHNLAIALIAAAVLALLALGALTMDARATFIGLSAMAMSLFVATLVLEALGYTLNTLVVVGLLMALGVVVDDAVVGCQRLAERSRERGHTSPQQLLRGFAELRGALGFATLIVLLAVAPLFFSRGLTPRLLHPLVLAFALAVTASMVVALVLTPALAALLLLRGRARRPLHRRIASLHRTALAFALRVPRRALLGLCALGLAGLIAVPFLGAPRRPAFQDRNIVVQWDGPPGTSLREMDRITARVEGELQAVPGVGDVGATIGRAVTADRIVGTSSSQLWLTIKSAADYGRTLAAVRSIVYGTPGMHAVVSTYEDQATTGVLAPADRNVVVRVYGEDYAVLGRLARRVSGLVSHVPGVGPPQIQSPTQGPGITVTVNVGAALRAGVKPGDVRREASTLVSGLTVGNFFERQAVFDVVVLGTPGVRASVDSIRNLEVDTVNGGHVPLGRIASVAVAPSPIDVQHEAISRYLDVTVPVHGRSVGSARAAIASRLGQIRYPVEYHAEALGQTPVDPTSHTAFLSYVAAAALGIFLLLQAAFGSWRLAALLFALLPLSTAGSVLVAAASGEWGSLGADVGLVAVLALAARQGTLLVVGIRRLQASRGGVLDRALVLRAADDRFASSLGALVVTGALLVPFAVIGDVAGNETAHTAAAVMLGGLVSAALVNVFVVPAICLAFGPTARAPVSESLDGNEEVAPPAPVSL